MKTELIMTKVTEGEEILQQLNTMRETVGRSSNVVHYVKEDVEKFRGIISKWQLTTKDILISSFGDTHRYVLSFEGTISRKDSGLNYKSEFEFEVHRGLDILESICESIENGVCETEGKSNHKKGNKVFVVHGHAESVNQEVARTIEKLGLECVILREQPNSGNTIIEKFESYAKDVRFAVILLTADDRVEGGNIYRARQNVIFEMGYFMGALGRSNVMCLLQENVEKPGDIDGVVYTLIDSAGHWKFDLVKELKACGYFVDANRVL